MKGRWRLFQQISLSLLVISIICYTEAKAAELTLTWKDNSANESGFRIERKTGTSGSSTEVAQVGTDVTSYVDSGLTAGTSYCYRVQAFNSAETSAFSNESCDTTASQTFTLSVIEAGNGSGMVSSNPAGINCGTTCSATYDRETVVTLSAVPAPGSTFAGWDGACSGTGTCMVTLTAATSVTATFLPNPPIPQDLTLTVTKAGNGNGVVSSNPAGISCGATCSATYDSESVVTLSASPAAGSTFAGWDGACRGTGSCTVTMATATSVTATFDLQLKVKIGIFRPKKKRWYLDLNGNGILEGCLTDSCVQSFGQRGDQPVVGDWLDRGTAQIGVFTPKTGLWKLDRNGNDLSGKAAA